MTKKYGNLDLRRTHCLDYVAGIRAFTDNYFELAIIDGPYGLGESSKKFDSRSKLANSGKYKRTDWDNKPISAEEIAEIRRVSKNQIYK